LVKEDMQKSKSFSQINRSASPLPLHPPERKLGSKLSVLFRKMGSKSEDSVAHESDDTYADTDEGDSSSIRSRAGSIVGEVGGFLKGVSRGLTKMTSISSFRRRRQPSTSPLEPESPKVSYAPTPYSSFSSQLAPTSPLAAPSEQYPAPTTSPHIHFDPLSSPTPNGSGARPIDITLPPITPVSAAWSFEEGASDLFNTRSLSLSGSPESPLGIKEFSESRKSPLGLSSNGDDSEWIDVDQPVTSKTTPMTNISSRAIPSLVVSTRDLNHRPSTSPRKSSDMTRGSPTRKSLESPRNKSPTAASPTKSISLNLPAERLFSLPRVSPASPLHALISDVNYVNENPSHLFWVPAHMHPDLHPTEYKSWLQSHDPSDAATTVSEAAIVAPPSDTLEGDSDIMASVMAVAGKKSVRRAKSFAERHVVITPENMEEFVEPEVPDVGKAPVGEVLPTDHIEGTGMRLKGMAPLKRGKKTGRSRGSGKRKGAVDAHGGTLEGGAGDVSDRESTGIQSAPVSSLEDLPIPSDPDAAISSLPPSPTTTTSPLNPSLSRTIGAVGRRTSISSAMSRRSSIMSFHGVSLEDADLPPSLPTSNLPATSTGNAMEGVSEASLTAAPLANVIQAEALVAKAVAVAEAAVAAANDGDGEAVKRIVEEGSAKNLDDDGVATRASEIMMDMFAEGSVLGTPLEDRFKEKVPDPAVLGTSPSSDKSDKSDKSDDSDEGDSDASDSSVNAESGGETESFIISPGRKSVDGILKPSTSPYSAASKMQLQRQEQPSEREALSPLGIRKPGRGMSSQPASSSRLASSVETAPVLTKDPQPKLPSILKSKSEKEGGHGKNAWKWLSNLLGPKNKKNGSESGSSSSSVSSLADRVLGGSRGNRDMIDRRRSSDSINDDWEDSVYPVDPSVDGHPRYPLHIEKAVYRLSHIKLAQPRRPLHEQVVISNLMLYILSVHADVTLNRQGPRGRKKRGKKRSRNGKGRGSRSSSLGSGSERSVSPNGAAGSNLRAGGVRRNMNGYILPGGDGEEDSNQQPAAAAMELDQEMEEATLNAQGAGIQQTLDPMEVAEEISASASPPFPPNFSMPPMPQQDPSHSMQPLGYPQMMFSPPPNFAPPYGPGPLPPLPDMNGMGQGLGIVTPISYPQPPMAMMPMPMPPMQMQMQMQMQMNGGPSPFAPFPPGFDPNTFHLQFPSGYPQLAPPPLQPPPQSLSPTPPSPNMSKRTKSHESRPGPLIQLGPMDGPGHDAVTESSGSARKSKTKHRSKPGSSGNKSDSDESVKSNSSARSVRSTTSVRSNASARSTASKRGGRGRGAAAAIAAEALAGNQSGGSHSPVSLFYGGHGGGRSASSLRHAEEDEEDLVPLGMLQQQRRNSIASSAGSVKSM
ncbi:hypothetical protein HDU67_001785, partial [Dinochytrium kinnereticum]